MASTPPNPALTAKEPLALPKGDGSYELIRGALIEYPLTSNLGGQVTSRIGSAVGNWADERD